MVWEIDVFKNLDNKSYFWMAEIELPEGQQWPQIVPSYIKENLMYKVPIEDCRFSSRRLSDSEYAMNLFNLLSKK